MRAWVRWPLRRHADGKVRRTQASLDHIHLPSPRCPVISLLEFVTVFTKTAQSVEIRAHLLRRYQLTLDT